MATMSSTDDELSPWPDLGSDAVLLSFFQSAYEAAAETGGWDRAELESRDGMLPRP
jgi:hypothetical protein